MDLLSERYHIYCTKNGRFSMAGINPGNVVYIAVWTPPLEIYLLAVDVTVVKSLLSSYTGLYPQGVYPQTFKKLAFLTDRNQDV